MKEDVFVVDDDNFVVWEEYYDFVEEERRSKHIDEFKKRARECRKIVNMFYVENIKVSEFVGQEIPTDVRTKHLELENEAINAQSEYITSLKDYTYKINAALTKIIKDLVTGKLTLKNVKVLPTPVKLEIVSHKGQNREKLEE